MTDEQFALLLAETRRGFLMNFLMAHPDLDFDDLFIQVVHHPQHSAQWALQIEFVGDMTPQQVIDAATCNGMWTEVKIMSRKWSQKIGVGDN